MEIAAEQFRRTFQFTNALFLPDIPIPKLTGPPIIGEEARFRPGEYVRTNFPNFDPICSDQIRHQASKNSNFVRISQSGLKKMQFYLFYRKLSTNPAKKITYVRTLIRPEPEI